MTPTEQSEILTRKAVDELWFVGDGHAKDYQRDAASVLLKTIPLTELLEVCRFASEINKTENWVEGMKDDEPLKGNGNRLADALTQLKAKLPFEL